MTFYYVFYIISHRIGFVPNYHNMRQAWMTGYDEEAVGGEEGGPAVEEGEEGGPAWEGGSFETQQGNTQHAEGDSQHLHLADQPSTRRGIAFYIKCIDCVYKLL